MDMESHKPVEVPELDLLDQALKKKALSLVEEGNKMILENRFFEARQLFSQSLKVFPTADAYTYLGWILTYDGFYTEAIDLCNRAIDLDPDFGNPYNDIGVYLMRLGQSEAAVSWFEKAKIANRYEPRHFPFLNLGLLFLKQGKLSMAKKEFMGVLWLVPDHEKARQYIMILDEMQIMREDPTVTH